MYMCCTVTVEVYGVYIAHVHVQYCEEKEKTKKKSHRRRRKKKKGPGKRSGKVLQSKLSLSRSFRLFDFLFFLAIVEKGGKVM